MSILLTGGSGFIGGFLTNNPNIKRTVVRSGLPKKVQDESTFEIANLDGSVNWEGAFEGVNTIIHLAGLAHSNRFSDENYHEVNVEGTLNLAKQAADAGVRRFVFVSSIGVNGTSTSQEPFSASDHPRPHNKYSASKWNAELELKRIAADTNLELVIVRPTLVYGPNAPGNFGALVKFIDMFPVLPFGMAKNKRDFISVHNLVDLLLCCATHPAAAGHTFLASDGQAVSIKGFTDSIAEGLGKKVIQLPIPVSVMMFLGKLFGRSEMIVQLFGNLEVNSSNIRQVLGWTPPFTMKQSLTLLRDTRAKE